ncbi:GNAT family N-acetyltransferase [Parasphingopyxis algicola]|uniref:GNAT family N-acetyltransferase n=1 Tax=Parasphingopyxis algicola TaxID=2026624 RepID=UPI0015A4C31F|nr:GNAT family N-acetyltransferase [Parasphingopyxis algicola]QLC23737.1 GNAT family N-acetyltransferase [Parasphingopyxis algicola]
MAPLIRAFEPSDSRAFADLNLAWIEEEFEIEDSDRQQLDDPQASIIAKGGRIVIAEIDGEVCGCGAVVPAHIQPVAGEYYVEIVKMAAKKGMRGHGIGRAVMARLLDEARAMGADGIWIETSDRLPAANRLYRSAGFRELHRDEFWQTPYNRCNTQLVMEL